MTEKVKPIIMEKRELENTNMSKKISFIGLFQLLGFRRKYQDPYFCIEKFFVGRGKSHDTLMDKINLVALENKFVWKDVNLNKIFGFFMQRIGYEEKKLGTQGSVLCSWQKITGKHEDRDLTFQLKPRCFTGLL